MEEVFSWRQNLREKEMERDHSKWLFSKAIQSIPVLWWIIRCWVCAFVGDLYRPFIFRRACAGHNWFLGQKREAYKRRKIKHLEKYIIKPLAIQVTNSVCIYQTSMWYPFEVIPDDVRQPAAEMQPISGPMRVSNSAACGRRRVCGAASPRPLTLADGAISHDQNLPSRKIKDPHWHYSHAQNSSPNLRFLFRLLSLDFPLLHHGCGWRNIPFHLWYLSSVRRFVVNLWRVGGWRTSRQNLRSNFRCHRTCPHLSKQGG